MTINEIVKAYKSGINLDEIYLMYEKLEDFDQVDKFNYDNTLYHVAAKFADAKAVDFLIQKGVRASINNKYGRTPLHLVADPNGNDKRKIVENEVYNTVVKLLEARISPLRKDDDGDTPLHEAAKWGNHEVIKALIDNNAKLDSMDNNGDTPLHIACGFHAKSDYSSLAYRTRDYKKVTENPGDASKMYIESITRMYHEDIEKVDNHFKTVKLLVDAGVDVDEKNKYGKTALDFAIEVGDKRLALVLKGEYNESDPLNDLRLKTGGMTIYQAVEKKDVEAITALIKMKTSINDLNDDQKSNYLGLSPLMIACTLLEPEIVEILVKNGANPNLKNSDGKTAMALLFTMDTSLNVNSNIFRDKKIQKMLKILKENGLNINDTIDDEYNTILTSASRYLDGASTYNGECLESVVIDEVIYYGIDVNIKNKLGQTAIMLICSADDKKADNMLITLIENGADINEKDINGDTPLIYASRNRSKTFAKSRTEILFELGKPDANQVNNLGKSALEIATEKDNEPLVKFLLTKI